MPLGESFEEFMDQANQGLQGPSLRRSIIAGGVAATVCWILYHTDVTEMAITAAAGSFEMPEVPDFNVTGAGFR